MGMIKPTRISVKEITVEVTKTMQVCSSFPPPASFVLVFCFCCLGYIF